MTPEDALADLTARADGQKAAEMAAYHKVERPYLGVANPVLDGLSREWRKDLTLEGRCALASGLWDTNVHEARILAAKLLTQARIKPDDGPVWDLIRSWVPTFDGWAVADHASIAGQKRLVANPDRLDTVETWTQSDHLWTRRAALVMTLPWTKQNHPKPAEIAARERILRWAARYAEDHQWFIQKAIAWWVRELSKHDAPRATAFLEAHGARLKPFAQREAGRYLRRCG